jgi:hypothetical protein
MYHDVFIIATFTNGDLSFLSFVTNISCPTTAMEMTSLKKFNNIQESKHVLSYPAALINSR